MNPGTGAPFSRTFFLTTIPVHLKLTIMSLQQFQGLPGGPFFMADSVLVTARKNDGGKPEEYQLTIFPDIYNEQLRAAGKATHYYYLTDRVSLSKNADGSYKFRFLKFAGVLDQDRNVAIREGRLEVAGGLLSFTASLQVPSWVLVQAKQQLLDQLAQPGFANHTLWAKSGIEPRLGAVPIISSDVSISTLDLSKVSVADSQNDEAFYYEVQGKGKGNLSPTGENAYTVTMGQLPSQIVESGFKGGSGPLNVNATIKSKFWIKPFRATLKGNWSDIHKHFSAELEGRYLFAKVEVQAAYNKAVTSGLIHQEITVDTTVVTEEKRKEYEAQLNKVYDKFMELAKAKIFDPVYKQPDNASVTDTTKESPWFVGFAFKTQIDITEINLDYSIDINEPYTQESIISSTMEGIYDQVAADAKMLDRYFSMVYLDEGYQKIHVIASANTWWPDEKGLGLPISRLGIEVGYPDSTGQIRWKSTAQFMKSPLENTLSKNFVPAIWTKDNADAMFVFDFLKLAGKIPAGIDPGKIYVRRHIYFKVDPRVEIKGYDIITPLEELNSYNVMVTAGLEGQYKVNLTLGTQIPNDKVQVNTILRKGNRTEVKVFNVANSRADYTDPITGMPATPPPVVFEGFSLNADKFNLEYKVEVMVKGIFPEPTLRWASDWKTLEITPGGSEYNEIVSVPEVPDALKDRVETYLNR